MSKSNTALIIVDIINDFQFDMGEALSGKTEAMAPDLLALKKHAHRMNWPIIYINDHFGIWQADIAAIIKKCQNRKSKNVIDRLAPNENDYFLIKPKHSAFYGTALDTLLNELAVNHLVITGIAGNICVLFTANDAYMREYDITLPKDCIASNTEKDNRYAITMMKDVLFANITTSCELISET
ncbi:isochorismatase [Bacillus glycinifermentans]|uniref:Cysteine hydrolase n=1 Tax=Bacillus glycinifermentans TaxID=1664069 RepID=A0A0J6EC52_9BACI|nr:isochorismatase family cysteine hydrolase [Bacillus glycinifermentans]ATH93957.1 cysteine hydrolase [Bacillus glycinifermentans]KMM55208.1 isochorismatase [Bacillus glycinifermentans]KRT94101.1 isochorismatase [Bacillus glycinifermentans]MEC0488005.1 cysteine hydrolase [Bacillus glycinifermentans]MEC0496505.1 cysteine hydrolase [Bacillus glycinifermentans]